MHLYRVAGHGVSGMVGQQVEEVPGWPFQFRDQGDLVQSLHPHKVRIGHFASMEGPGSSDIV